MANSFFTSGVSTIGGGGVTLTTVTRCSAVRGFVASTAASTVSVVISGPGISPLRLTTVSTLLTSVSIENGMQMRR